LNDRWGGAIIAKYQAGAAAGADPPRAEFSL